MGRGFGVLKGLVEKQRHLAWRDEDLNESIFLRAEYDSLGLCVSKKTLAEHIFLRGQIYQGCSLCVTLLADL